MRNIRVVNIRKVHALTVALALLLSALCAAADDGEKPPPKKDNVETPKADPTQASAKLKQALKGPEKAEVKLAPVVKIPEILLKGLIQTEGKPASAVLEIKGKGNVTVVEGSRVMLPGDENHALVIKKVEASGVQIEIPGVKDLMIVK